MSVPVGRRGAGKPLIGIFAAPEQQREPVSPVTRLRATSARQWVLWPPASSSLSISLRLRTGGHKTFFIFNAPPVGLRYPQRQIERMVTVPQFLANRAFFTLNETLPPLE